MDYSPVALLVLLLGLFGSLADARVLNITNLENCADLEDGAVVLRTITYHIDEAKGVCDTVHGEMIVKRSEHKNRFLTLTLFKCGNANSNEPCLENPTVHEETLGCERLIDDDSGPWAMFSEAIRRSNCGKDTGEYSVDYSTLKLDHLMKYLEIHDEDFARFRLRMHFLSVESNTLRACVDLDFKLLV